MSRNLHEWQSRTFFEKNAVYSAFFIEGGENRYEANGDEFVWNVWECSCPFIWRMGYRTADIGSFYGNRLDHRWDSSAGDLKKVRSQKMADWRVGRAGKGFAEKG